MLLAPHRQVRRSIDSSIIGTPMPAAAAPYRASGLVRWHKTDMLADQMNVRCQGVKRTSGRRFAKSARPRPDIDGPREIARTKVRAARYVCAF
jgi:hypothetical protein